MKAGLCRPLRLLQLLCVVVTVLLTAAYSSPFSLAQGFGPQDNTAKTAAKTSAKSVTTTTAAKPPVKTNFGNLSDRLNANTVAIVSGNPNATYLTIAYDLSAVLDDGDNFRVLPIVGKGGGQNIRDVRFLKGVDLGITQSILLNQFRKSGEIGTLDDKIVYITKLFNEEMHIVVRSDSGIDTLDQLNGKKVNFSDIGSGSQLSTRDIFQRLGIKAQEVNMGQADAFEKMKSGEIAATVLIAGKPAAAMAKVKAADGFRFLPVPFTKPLQGDYLPAELDHVDYPGMVDTGHDVDTVAVSAVLIAYNWPRGTDRYRRIAKFVDEFFPRLAEFQQPPRHPKWRETNLAAVLPGWTRFPAAQEWLLRNRETQPVAVSTREQFDQFLAARRTSGGGAEPRNASERELLFQDFLQWQARQAH
jgi:TRAP transporter TAXI family solute receptor